MSSSDPSSCSGMGSLTNSPCLHESAEAREDVKRIIAEELAEARIVGMIIRNGEADLRCRHVMLVCGTVLMLKELPPSRIRVMTRSGGESELNP